jgi:hypothetical protein
MKTAMLLGLLLSPAAFAGGQPSCKPDPQSPGMFQLSCGTTVVGPVGDAQTCAMMGQMLCPQMPAPAAGTR